MSTEEKGAPKKALDAVSDPPSAPTPPPQEVKLEELDLLRIQNARLKVNNHMTLLRGMDAEMARAQEAAQDLRQQQIDLERTISDRLGLPIPLTAYVIDEKRGVAVLQQPGGQQRQQGPTPQQISAMMAQQRAEAAEADKKE